MNKKRKIGRKLLSFLLTLAMVFGTFTGIVPGTGITAKADTSDTGVEVLIADINCECYKDKTTSFTTDDGLANISFSAIPTFDDEYGWYNPNGELTITVTAANEDYPISKCVFQCFSEGREDSTAPFEVTISHGGNWQNTTATINGVSESSKGLKHIGIFSRITPDYTVLKDGMLIKPGESIIPGDYYYKTAEHVNTEFPEEYADFKKNTLYTLVKGKIESRQVDPSYPDCVEDVFVESSDGDHYAFLQVANGKYIFDGSWEVTNHADGLLVSQGTSEKMNNPEERITTYAFSVHEKVFNDVTVDNTIENGSIEIKDSEGTAISEAEAGSIVTLDVSANTGYKLKEISANYLEVQSVSELMELIGSGKCYENQSNPEESNYFEVVDNSIKVYAWTRRDYLYSLPSTVKLDTTRSSEGIYTAIGTYNDAPLTWIFKVKNGKIISIGFESNGVDWGIVNIESTGTIAEPTYASVELTPVTTGKQYTFTMPATDVTVNAVFEEDSAQNTWTSGDCTVTYDSDTKTMTVTGNGAMGSYESEDQVPWKGIKESVEKIVIDEGVTSIGENVFYYFGSVKEIYISSTVRNIKNHAFYNYTIYSSNVYFTRPSVDCELQIDGMPFNLDYWTLNYSGDGKYVLYDKNIDLENASSVTKLIGNWEADGAGGSIYTTKIFTWKIPTSSITCISEHGVVTASVGGTDVTTAEVGDEVTLKVKPDLGYQLKSITATFPKDGVETFDDLVGLMGDAVINGDTKFNQFGEYTCKVENGQFAIYNGNDLVSRTSDITDFEVRDNGHTIIFNSGNLSWYFVLDRDTGNIIVISVSYLSNYNNAFVSADNSESTGTLPPNDISLTTVKEGSDYKFIMPKRDVTIKTEYEKVAVVTKAPEANTLTYNGKAQKLVTAGTATGGEMQYALGTKTEDTGEYSTSIPTATAAGTYYVWYKVEGDANHNDTEAACVTVTIRNRPSSGGSSAGTTINVPVSSDSASVSVTASVSGATASVKALTETELNKVVNSDTHTGEVEIDVSGLGRTVTVANIPTETVKMVEKAVSDTTNDATGLTVKLTGGSITLDAQALSAVAEQAKGSTIQLNLDGIAETKMTSAQRETVQTMDVQAVYDAYMTSGGQRISDFHGGRATVMIPYTLKDGQNRNGIVVWYVADDGGKTEMPTAYDGKQVSFTTTHFSNYVVAYDVERAAVCPQDATCPISKFTDADAKAWYHDGVHWALDNGVMNGVESSKFNPNGDTTRAMVVTMLWRMENSPAVNYAMSFSDVESDTWYTEAVRWANAEGVVEGDGGKFNPNGAVTREQLATMLYRYAQYKKADVSASADLGSFNDAATVSGWATSAMQWAVGSGIINGIDGNLAPAGNATRAQVATMLMRYSTAK